MPLFMDIHSIEGGVSEADAAAAHQADLAEQGAHGVNYLRYWVDQEAGKIFCLVDAPDAGAWPRSGVRWTRTDRLTAIRWCCGSRPKRWSTSMS
jgi:hypothetical protein